MKVLPEITMCFRIIDEKGKTLTTIKRTGKNKNTIQWQAEKFASKKYGEKVKLHFYKTLKESD